MVDCVPSVIDSPKATIAPVCPDAITSTPASQNHAGGVGVVASAGMTTLAVKSPGVERYMVCRASKCQVAGPVFPGTKMLTAKSPSAGTSNSTGSLNTGAPGGMVMEGLPPKASDRSDPGTIAAPAA